MRAKGHKTGSKVEYIKQLFIIISRPTNWIEHVWVRTCFHILQSCNLIRLYLRNHTKLYKRIIIICRR